MKLFAHHGLTEFVHLRGLPRPDDQGLLPQLRGAEQRLHDHARRATTSVAVPRHPPRDRLGGHGRRHRRARPRPAAGSSASSATSTATPSSSPTATASPTSTSPRCSPSTARHGKLATVTTTRPLSRFGIVDVDDDARSSAGSARSRRPTSGSAPGFFVFEREFLDYLDDDCILERAPLERLAPRARSSRTGTTASGSRWTPTASS